jgi:hypothetical protein
LIAGNNAQENKVQAEAIIDFLDIKAGVCLHGRVSFKIIERSKIGKVKFMKKTFAK